MRHGIFAMLALAIIALAAGAQADAGKKTQLSVGDMAPSFEAPDEEGATWQSARHVGKKIIVVYFYPGDFTPGCTAQAQKFRDHMNKISALGAEVVGISGDSSETHGLFKEAYQLNYNLLADEDGGVAKRFGVPVGKGATVKTRGADKKPLTIERAVTIARWTFVIDLDGKIAYMNTKVDPLADSKQIEAFLKKGEK